MAIMAHIAHKGRKKSSSSPMAHPLYLTADEKKVFASLPAKLQEGWKVEMEKQKYEDTAKRRQIRFEFMDLHDKHLLEFREKAYGASSQREFEAIVETLDVTKLSEHDVRELFFAIGPDGMSLILYGLLSDAKTDDDLESISALTHIRSMLLKSMLSAS